MGSTHDDNESETRRGRGARILKRSGRAAFSLVFAMCGSAWAGRPLNTDDASILPEGGCQLETWLRRARDLHEIVVQPACNPWGGVEWGAILASARPVDGSAQSSLGLQAKTVFKEVQPGSWGAGLTIGATRHTDGDVAGTTRMGTLIFSGAPSCGPMKGRGAGSGTFASSRPAASANRFRRLARISGSLPVCTR